MTDTFRPSSLEKYFLCPGSYTAEQGLPELPLDPARESGIRIHRALAKQVSDLAFQRSFALEIPITDLGIEDGRELTIFNKFIAKLIVILTDAGYAHLRFYPECPLNKDCDEKFSLPTEGTADLIVLASRFIDGHDPDLIVFDWKTGYAEQIDATRNLQLRDYCILAAWQFIDDLPKNVIGWIFSAGDTGDAQFTKVEFTEDDLLAAKDEIGNIIVACEDSPNSRFPGEVQCKYCRACGNLERCPESVSNLNVTVSTAEALTIAVKPLPPAMSNVVHNVFLQFKQLEAAKDRFNSWLKEVIKAYPDSVPWAELKPGKSRRTVTDPELVFQKGIAGKWFDQKQFMGCIKVSVPDVEKLVKQNLDITAKQANELVNSVLTEAKAIMTEQDAPSIVVKKE